MPQGMAVEELSPAILGLEPARAYALARLLGLTRDETISRLGRIGAPETVQAGGLEITVRPGTADVFTIDDTFGAAYHRSPWQLPDAPLILDLGTNVGLTILDYSQQHPGATIVGVELDAENAQLARRNTAHLPNVTIRQAGVAAREGTVHYGLASANAFTITAGGEHSAPGITMWQLVSPLDRHVDLVKMDIEGAEAEVLADGTEWSSRVDRMLVETHSPYTREQCVRDLERLGFAARIDNRHPAGVSGSRAV